MNRSCSSKEQMHINYAQGFDITLITLYIKALRMQIYRQWETICLQVLNETDRSCRCNLEQLSVRVPNTQQTKQFLMRLIYIYTWLQKSLSPSRLLRGQIIIHYLLTLKGNYKCSCIEVKLNEVQLAVGTCRQHEGSIC